VDPRRDLKLGRQHKRQIALLPTRPIWTLSQKASMSWQQK
jgi:hypothetical protein